MVDHLTLQLALRARALTLSVAVSAPFARASTATYYDINGVVQTAAINVLRNAHYLSGVLQPPLIESSATNAFTRSQELDDAVWVKARSSVTANALTAPDGTLTADKLVEDSTASSTHQVSRALGTMTDNTVQSFTVFAKAGERVQLYLAFVDKAGANTYRVFNLDSGTLGIGIAPATIQPLGNGWYRCSVSISSASGATTPSFTIAPCVSDSANYSGNGTSGLYLWGVQYEKDAAVPTSYIPTVSAPVTRAADVDSLLAATATGYARTNGSFLTDGFAAGMEITPVGFASNPIDVIKSVTALNITTKNPRSVESALAGRSITIGLPSDRAWENFQLTPTQGKPYVEEQYIPGPMTLESEGAFGNVTLEPMYQLQINVPEGVGIGAASRYADALTRLFAPGTEIPVGSEILFVRPMPGPFRGQRQIGAPGFSTIPFTAPLRIYTTNSI